MKNAYMYIYRFTGSRIFSNYKAAQKSLCLIYYAYKKFACNLVIG